MKNDTKVAINSFIHSLLISTTAIGFYSERYMLGGIAAVLLFIYNMYYKDNI